MRLQIEVATTATGLPWRDVLGPGRGVAYHLLRWAAPGLATHLHDHGWGRHGLTPFGYGPPVFPSAPRRPGVYAAGGVGRLEFGSPLTEVVRAWARALAETPVIAWGGTALRVLGVTVAHPPTFAAGRARLRTVTPVVLKGSGRDETGTRTTRQAWVLPGEPEFASCLEQNLRRKAECLGLAPQVHLDAVTWVGPRRSFTVGRGSKVGAPVEVELTGDPAILRAIWSWGLGQSNSAGFGWVAADVRPYHDLGAGDAPIRYAARGADAARL